MVAVLVFLSNGFIRLQAIVVSLAKIAFGGGCGYLGWVVGRWGWHAPGALAWIGLGCAGYLSLMAAELICKGLPAITPRPQGYRPGRATTAGLKDLRKAGIVK